MYRGTAEQLEGQVNRLHRPLLKAAVKPYESVLDVCCGYGRFLELVEPWWKGDYTGMDFCPELIQEARLRHPGRLFGLLDVRCLLEFYDPIPPRKRWDVGLLLWTAEMLRENRLQGVQRAFISQMVPLCKQVIIIG